MKCSIELPRPTESAMSLARLEHVPRLLMKWCALILGVVKQIRLRCRCLCSVLCALLG